MTKPDIKWAKHIQATHYDPYFEDYLKLIDNNWHFYYDGLDMWCILLDIMDTAFVEIDFGGSDEY